jgi:methylthioribose-1-phosphate isomerase
MTSDIRPVAWDRHTATLVLIDQTQLPQRMATISCRTVDQVVDAIARLVVRGAPALGAVGGYGVAIALLQAEREGWTDAVLADQVDRIRLARPTAVNLAWGVDRVHPYARQGVQAVLAEADRILLEDEQANRALSALGADWIRARVRGTRSVRVLTHCNAGALATSAWGTALGIVRELHARGELDHVFADETRPLLQGSRLTAWELQQDGIEVSVQADAAAASTIMRGMVDVAIIGADRIARNGDTANKIGSLGVALACQAGGIPFVVAAPTSTVDLATACGEDIQIELRDGAEVTQLAGLQTTPEGVIGFNPAFDVTPWQLISAIVTESGIVVPDGRPLDRVVTAHAAGSRVIEEGGQ